MTPLTQAQCDLLSSFRLTRQQKAEVWAAWLASPDGTERCCLQAQAEGARRGNTGAGLLLTVLRRGDHLADRSEVGRRVTGWKWVRGTHSGTYVRDPSGTDPLPAGYDLVTRAPWGRREAVA